MSQKWVKVLEGENVENECQKGALGDISGKFLSKRWEKKHIIVQFVHLGSFIKCMWPALGNPYWQSIQKATLE